MASAASREGARARIAPAPPFATRSSSSRNPRIARASRLVDGETELPFPAREGGEDQVVAAKVMEATFQEVTVKVAAGSFPVKSALRAAPRKSRLVYFPSKHSGLAAEAPRRERTL